MKTDPQRIAVTEIDRRFVSLRLASPTDLRRLRSSIERDGIRHPLLVSSAVERERLVLLDGFKRIRVTEELEVPSVLVQIVALDAAQSKAAILHSNQAHPGLSDVEEAWIVRSLCREHAMTQPSVGTLLGRDKSWVCRRLKLAEQLETSLQDDLRLGLLSSTSARELSRLPRGNQIRAADAVRTHALSSRQTARLVQVLKETDSPVARRDVLAEPLRYLATEAPSRTAVESDPRLSEGGNILRRILLSWDGMSSHIARSLSRHAPAGLAAQDAHVLGPLVHRAIRSGRRATQQLETVQTDSGLQARAGGEHA